MVNGEHLALSPARRCTAVTTLHPQNLFPQTACHHALGPHLLPLSEPGSREPACLWVMLCPGLAQVSLWRAPFVYPASVMDVGVPPLAAGELCCEHGGGSVWVSSPSSVESGPRRGWAEFGWEVDLLVRNHQPVFHGRCTRGSRFSLSWFLLSPAFFLASQPPLSHSAGRPGRTMHTGDLCNWHWS